MRLKFVVASLVVVAANLASAQQASSRDWTPAATAWWAHVQYLADDKLEGPKTGTPGYEAAVQYVEGQFKQIGLKPAGTTGYRQNVELVPTQVDRDASSFKVDDHAYDLAHIVMLSPHITGNGTIDAPMVFIGYGLSLPRRHIDDLAGIDLKGKVAVFYNAAPDNLLGPAALLRPQRSRALESSQSRRSHRHDRDHASASRCSSEPHPRPRQRCSAGNAADSALRQPGARNDARDQGVRDVHAGRRKAPLRRCA